MSNAYVYAIIVDGVARYIGKGKGRRFKHHMREVISNARRRAVGEVVRESNFYRRLTKAWLAGAEIEEVIIVDGMTDEAAYEREMEEIAAAPLGQLWNMREGGAGMTSADAKRRWESNEYRERVAAGFVRLRADPNFRKRHSDACKASLASPEARERISRGTKAGLADPIVREARRQTQLVAAARPENKAKKSVAAKAKWRNPEYRERLEATIRATFANPEFRARLTAERKARAATPEGHAHMKAMAQKVKERWGDPEFRARMIAIRKVTAVRRRGEILQ